MFDSSIGIFILWLKNYSCWNLLLKTVISWLSSFDDLKDFKHTPWYWSLKMMRLPIQFETVFKTFLSHSVFCSYGWTSFVVFFRNVSIATNPPLPYDILDFKWRTFFHFPAWSFPTGDLFRSTVSWKASHLTHCHRMNLPYSMTRSCNVMRNNHASKQKCSPPSRVEKNLFVRH